MLNIHRCLHRAFEQARKWRLVSENPARDARAPSPARSRARAFKTDEVQRLLDVASANPVTYAMAATKLTCGLRRSELIGLCFDAIDFDKGQLEIRRVVLEAGHRVVVREQAKTATSARKLKIPPALVPLLRAQLVRVQEQVLKCGREYQRDP